jgi:predicted nucleic acid-binding protein
MGAFAGGEATRPDRPCRPSAWTVKHRDPAVQRNFDDQVHSGEIGTCDVVRFELPFTTRDHASFVATREELEALPDVSIGRGVWQRALDVFELLAARGPLHHRQTNLPDLLVAAAAEQAGLQVLHYDRDFELIAEVTGQPVRAIAPLGSLG